MGLAIAGAAFLGFWMLFVFQMATSEFLAALLASALTLFAACESFRTVPTCFQPKLKWVGQVWRIPGVVCADMWLLVKHLVRQFAGQPSRSSFQTASLRPAEGECRVTSQRALATLLVSITPNSVVLSIDPEAGEILFHQLEPASVPEVLRSLGE